MWAKSQPNTEHFFGGTAKTRFIDPEEQAEERAGEI